MLSSRRLLASLLLFCTAGFYLLNTTQNPAHPPPDDAVIQEGRSKPGIFIHEAWTRGDFAKDGGQRVRGIAAGSAVKKGQLLLSIPLPHIITGGWVAQSSSIAWHITHTRDRFFASLPSEEVLQDHNLLYATPAELELFSMLPLAGRIRKAQTRVSRGFQLVRDQPLFAGPGGKALWKRAVALGDSRRFGLRGSTNQSAFIPYADLPNSADAPDAETMTWGWSEERQAFEMRARRDVAVGEELTIAYQVISMKPNDELALVYGFLWRNNPTPLKAPGGGWAAFCDHPSPPPDRLRRSPSFKVAHLLLPLLREYCGVARRQGVCHACSTV